MRFLTSCAVVLAIVMSHPKARCETPGNDQEGIKKIRRYLAVKYDEYEERPDGGRAVLGPAYNEEAPLTPIKAAELLQFFPKTLFFVTELDAPHYEYSKVAVVVCITSTEAGDDIRSCLSPTYSEASPKFLSLFTGLLAKSPDQKRSLAVGLGKLLAAVTHKGEVRSDKTNSDSATIELWHGDLHWRNVAVVFDKDGRSQHVLVLNPKKE